MDALAQMYENKIRRERKEQGEDFDEDDGDLNYDWRALVKFMDEEIADLMAYLFNLRG